ncbi:hypothetical protein ACN27F_07860 [Solwaraspora sp. WMMB335]|uniref:hypothetical protein n=1 Tax=Solwaraspora sp. WMMB335 TaxID=3404118 RepID=UPI003B9343C4
MLRALRDPVHRWSAAALLFLLATTAVHGAASVAVPSVAHAAGPASIGAALLHQSIAPGARGSADAGDADAGERRRVETPHCPPGDPDCLPIVVAAGWTAMRSTACHRLRRPADRCPLRTDVRTNGSRGPPYRPRTALSDS